MTLSSGALRADPGFRRYLAARVVSTAGTLVTAVVLPVLVYRLTGSVAWTAAVVVAEALPHLVLAPAVTAIATRLKNHGRLLVTADLAAAALLTSIPVAWWTGGMSAWHVLGVAAALQVAFLLLQVGQAGVLRTLVGAAATAAGRAALRGASGLVELMVPPLAGLAVVIVAPAPLLCLDAVSFLASALLVRAAIRSRTTRSEPAAPSEPATRERVRAGVRFLWANPPSWTLALAGTLHAAAGAVYLAMLLPWADRQLGVPPSGDARLALLVSCWGLGAIAGCATFLPLVRRFGAVRLARTSMGLSLAGGVGVLLSTHWLPAVLTGLLWGAGHTVAAKAALDALGHPAGAVTHLLWRGAGPVTGAALAGAVAVGSSARTGLAVGVGLLALAVLLVRRGTRLAPPGTVPAQAGPSRARADEHPAHTPETHHRTPPRLAHPRLGPSSTGG